MSYDSETVEDTKEGSLAEVTDDSYKAEFLEIPPLERLSDVIHTPEFIDSVVGVKPEDLQEMKQEPADENDNGDWHCYVKQEASEVISCCYVKQEPADGYVITMQVSSLMFMFHLFLCLMKLLKSKSAVDQLLTTLLHRRLATRWQQFCA